MAGCKAKLVQYIADAGAQSPGQGKILWGRIVVEGGLLTELRSVSATPYRVTPLLGNRGPEAKVGSHACGTALISPFSHVLIVNKTFHSLSLSLSPPPPPRMPPLKTDDAQRFDRRTPSASTKRHWPAWTHISDGAQMTKGARVRTSKAARFEQHGTQEDRESWGGEREHYSEREARHPQA